MKKIITSVLFCLLSTLSCIAAALPNKATVGFTIADIERGKEYCPTLLENAHAVVRYEYDFRRNIGFALISQIQATQWTQMLYPVGLTNMYSFMSDMPPTTIHLNGGDVTVYRLLFKLQMNGDSQLTLMLGAHGECIMRSNVINVLQNS